jgi:hypothetical protein
MLVFCVAMPSCGRVGVELLPADGDVRATDRDAEMPLGAPEAALQEDAEADAPSGDADVEMPPPSLDGGEAVDANQVEQPTIPSPSLDGGAALDAAPARDADVPPSDAGAGLDAGVSTDAGVDAAAPADAELPPCGGAWVRGLCWYFGAFDNSCQQVCSSRGGYDARTPGVVGTVAQGGSVQACNEVLAALGQSGSATPARRSDDKGYGCHLWGSDLWWIENMPAFSPSVAGPSARIACACLR